MIVDLRKISVNPSSRNLFRFLKTSILDLTWQIFFVKKVMCLLFFHYYPYNMKLVKFSAQSYLYHYFITLYIFHSNYLFFPYHFLYFWEHRQDILFLLLKFPLIIFLGEYFIPKAGLMPFSSV